MGLTTITKQALNTNCEKSHVFEQIFKKRLKDDKIFTFKLHFNRFGYSKLFKFLFIFSFHIFHDSFCFPKINVRKNENIKTSALGRSKQNTLSRFHPFTTNALDVRLDLMLEERDRKVQRRMS